VDWDRYKRLCDQPNVVSKWLLEQTLELVVGEGIAAALRRALDSPALIKPVDHRGGAATDMCVLDLSRGQCEEVLQQVQAARDAGAVTSTTTERGLGGFVEAWREYLDWRLLGIESNNEKGKCDER
jgi:hypothetical protein